MSFAPNAKCIFWHADVGDPPRESVIAASPPPLVISWLAVVGLNRIKEGLAGEWEKHFKKPKFSRPSKKVFHLSTVVGLSANFGMDRV